jgi:hypothetical protein
MSAETCRKHSIDLPSARRPAPIGLSASRGGHFLKFLSEVHEKMKVVYLAKQNPFLIGWMEVKEGEEFDCPECLARHKVVDGKIVRVVWEYDKPCPHTSWREESEGTLKVYFTRYEEKGELAKQDEGEYISEHVNIRKSGLKSEQLNRILGFLDWQKETFPQVLKDLEEAEELLWQMKSGDPEVDEKVRVAVWYAKTKVKALVDWLEKHSSELV